MGEAASQGELTYRRVHDAPRELLFECMTRPEHLAHFWGPAGTTTPVDGITVDLRPGGVFETVMINNADGSAYTMRAVYVEVRRPGRLVWTEPGVEGGMTTGDPLVVRGYMKPLPTLTKPLRSVDIATHEPAEALRERTDSCTVPAAGVVGEAMVAFVLADAYRRKFGGDHIDDVIEAVRAYQQRIGWLSS